MIEDKINYYINRIKNLREELKLENEKIFDYENLLIKEKKEHLSKSFFSRIFSKSNHIDIISGILIEHSSSSYNKEKQIKETIEELIKLGSNSSTVDELLILNMDKIKLKSEEKEYLIQIQSKVNDITVDLKKSYSQLKYLNKLNSYKSNSDYKVLYFSFVEIMTKISGIKDLITAYKIFDQYNEKINYSINISLKKLEKILNIDKYKELNNYIFEFEHVVLNLDIICEVFINNYNSIENELKEIKSEELKLIKNKEIIFINNLLVNRSFDITTY